MTCDGGGPRTVDYTLATTYQITQLTDSGPPPIVVPFTFDGDGRCTRDDRHLYTYDAQGRLVEARQLAGLAVVLTQEFDPTGRVSRRTENGATTTFTRFALRMLQESTAGGAPRVQYAYGAGIDELIAESDGQNRLPLQDAVQTVLGFADSTGTVLERYRYRAFGEVNVFAPDGVTVRPVSAISARPRFAGHPLLALGLYDARARVFDPRTGRFLQPDPFEYVDSADRYGYVHHDPVNWIDPAGEVALLVGLAVAAGVGLLMGLGTEAVRQTIQILEGSRKASNWGERLGDLALSGGAGAVLGPFLVLLPELAIPLVGMGVASATDPIGQRAHSISPWRCSRSPSRATCARQASGEALCSLPYEGSGRSTPGARGLAGLEHWAKSFSTRLRASLELRT
jgi:RHS repeat-associated protein